MKSKSLLSLIGANVKKVPDWVNNYLKSYVRRDDKFSKELAYKPFTACSKYRSLDFETDYTTKLEQQIRHSSSDFSCSTSKKDRLQKMNDQRLKCLLKPFTISDQEIHEIYKRLNADIHKGLTKKGNKSASVKCFITFIHHLPTGNEKGRYLAMDLGGTNFRVLAIDLQGDNKFTVKSQFHKIENELMVGSGEKLFDHIADCLEKFLREQNLLTKNLPLGFTFSFPCFQTALDKAILTMWTKGYNASGVEKEDIGRLLNEAFARHTNMKVKLVAIINDTSGTLVTSAYHNPNCKIGAIIGTGFNACYWEKTKNAELLPDEYRCHDHVVINTEWGAFGDNGCLDFIRTEYDYLLEETSINPGRQTYEKMISGMYLGEITRVVLIDVIQKGIFEVPDKEEALKRLCTPQSILTMHLSEIESDKNPDFMYTRQHLKDILCIDDATNEQCVKLQYICQCVARRAAHLAAIGISVLLNKIEDECITVGIDGTLFRKHPNFRHYMAEVLEKLVDPAKTYELVISEDGSGVGAAMTACIEDAE